MHQIESLTHILNQINLILNVRDDMSLNSIRQNFNNVQVWSLGCARQIPETLFGKSVTNMVRSR